MTKNLCNNSIVFCKNQQNATDGCFDLQIFITILPRVQQKSNKILYAML